MRPKVFISYAHKDEGGSAQYDQWLSYVQSHFAPLKTLAQIEAWSDTDLQGGVDWRNRIFAAIDACDIFVLLVSRHAMASNFILDEEVPRILQRQQQAGSTETPLLYPIVITPCANLRDVHWLQTPNRRPTDGKALSDFPWTSSENQRDPQMRSIAEDIAKHARRLASASNPASVDPEANRPPAAKVPVPLTGRQIVDGYYDMPSQSSDRVLLDIGFIEAGAITIPNHGRVVFGVKSATLTTKVTGARITEIRTAFAQGFSPPAVSVLVQPTAGRVVRHFDICRVDEGTLSGNPLRDTTEQGGPIEIFSVSDVTDDFQVEGSVSLDVSGVHIEDTNPVCTDAADQRARDSMMETLAKTVLDKHGAVFELGAYTRDQD